MNDDLRELLESLKSREVEFLIIGGHAVSFHSRPRMTEDVDIWINPEERNAARLKEALDQFGAPIGVDGARQFSERGRQMIRLGVPPNMVDLVNFGGTRPFSSVWDRRVIGKLGDIEVPFPSKDDLIEMKEFSGREVDLADIARLRASKKS